jgi:hypothetical protein
LLLWKKLLLRSCCWKLLPPEEPKTSFDPL